MSSPAVTVLGAGPAGAACAIALARAGAGPVVLVDGGRRPGPAIGETIPPGTRALLVRLGLWPAFAAEGHERCPGSTSAWGSDVLGHNDFLLDPQGSGWHLDRARFDELLRGAARAAGVHVVTGTAADAVAGAAFVVDATGRASAYAKACGARQLALDRLTFVYGFFDTRAAASRSALTLLEAVPDGWWYAAALPGSRLAAAFAGDADHVRAAGLARPERWLPAALATRHLGRRLTGCELVPGSVVPRVAYGFRLDRFSGPRWLAAGDAAACYDPLSGQGIHKALQDGIDAAAAITAALGSGGDLDGTYERAVAARFDEYLVNRNHFYGLERRWPDSPFWRRRHDRRTLAAAATA